MTTTNTAATPGTNTGETELEKSIQQRVKRTERFFDVSTLPSDMQRVYSQLKDKHDEQYALVFLFIMRTAIELHRAWHMTLLTSKILQQIKDEYDIVTTWELGVFRLKFRIDDGAFEIHRKVPYDYDSEYQDIYMRISEALCAGDITVHEALIYQTETKLGKHTAPSGLFLRDFPGRLVLYPLLALTCAVIFFGGDWDDAGIAALCGFASGIIEYFFAEGLGGEAKILIDIVVGTSTGVISGLFFRYQGESQCLPAIFLGTLYWFFYGTAFVIGLLEIIAGELETGVTRFIAVSVKTFVLCLGTGFGMILTLQDPSEAWLISTEQNCGRIDLSQVSWRIPLYLLCSAAALGQYRFPIIGYWRGLAVQLAGYEAQYRMQIYLEGHDQEDRTNMDTAGSNIVGAAAAVVVAALLSYIMDQVRFYYYGRLLQRDENNSSGRLGIIVYYMVRGLTRLGNFVGIGRKDDVDQQTLGEKLRQQSLELDDPAHPRNALELELDEDKMLVDILVDAQNKNVWAVLMPAVYQLVPGSMIARLWFNSIFPPPLRQQQEQIQNTGFFYTVFSLDQAQENVFSNLMVISTSLALGLILGFALVSLIETLLCGVLGFEDTVTDIYGGVQSERRRARKKDLRGGMYTADDDDPNEDLDEAIEEVPQTDGESPQPTTEEGTRAGGEVPEAADK